MTDIRYAARQLARHPGFSIFAVLILALAAGAATAVFSLVNAVLLRPLPGVRDPSGLVTFYRTQKGDRFDNFGYPDYCDFRDRSRTLAAVAAHSGAAVNFRTAATERVRADLVTENYFTLLGVAPAAGRLLAPGDGDAAVLSYDFWRQRFAGSAEAVGARMAINGFPFTVVGVAPHDFHGTVAGAAFDLWIPLSSQPRAIPRMSANILQNRAAGWIEIFGRLQRGVSAARADAEMSTIAQQLARQYPITNGGRSVAVIPGLGWYPDDRAEASRLLKMLGAAAALLAAIACANLAGLFLVRASQREREIAIRLSVGAGRGRVVRLLVAEGMIVAAAAAGFGLLLAGSTAGWMASIRPSSTLRNLDVGIDGRVLAFALAASALAGLVLSLLPALAAVPAHLASALKQGSPGSGLRRTRWRAALLVAQVAVSFLLLAAGGVLARDLRRLMAADPGYATANLAMGAIDLTLQRYPEDRGLAIYRQLLDRLPVLPGVVSATLAGTVPPAEWPGRESIFHPGEEPPQDVLQGREFELGLRTDINLIGPRYFETLGIRLMAGRDFTARDDSGAPLVAIVNQALATRMWPGQNPIGKRFAWPRWGQPRRPPVEVVGLAADTRSRALDAAAVPLLYAPTLQNYGGRTRLVVRTHGSPAAVIPDLNRAVAAVDPDLALFAPETMEEHVAQSLWSQRMAMAWIGILSLLALGLTAVGLYGVIAQWVAQRKQEVGIRMALGSAPGAISRLFWKEGMGLCAAGVGIAFPVALAGSHDPGFCVTVAATLAAILSAACWLPARKGARVDPLAVLKAG
jgi:predicted permease